MEIKLPLLRNPKQIYNVHTLFSFQPTKPLEKPFILTKHCTVRLNRIPKLDKMSGRDTVYLKQLKQPNDVVDNNKVIYGLIHALLCFH